MTTREATDEWYISFAVPMGFTPTHLERRLWSGIQAVSNQESQCLRHIENGVRLFVDESSQFSFDGGHFKALDHVYSNCRNDLPRSANGTDPVILRGTQSQDGPIFISRLQLTICILPVTSNGPALRPSPVGLHHTDSLPTSLSSRSNSRRDVSSCWRVYSRREE